MSNDGDSGAGTGASASAHVDGNSSGTEMNELQGGSPEGGVEPVRNRYIRTLMTMSTIGAIEEEEEEDDEKVDDDVKLGRGSSKTDVNSVMAFNGADFMSNSDLRLEKSEADGDLSSNAPSSSFTSVPRLAEKDVSYNNIANGNGSNSLVAQKVAGVVVVGQTVSSPLQKVSNHPETVREWDAFEQLKVPTSATSSAASSSPAFSISQKYFKSSNKVHPTSASAFSSSAAEFKSSSGDVVDDEDIAANKMKSDDSPLCCHSSVQNCWTGTGRMTISIDLDVEGEAVRRESMDSEVRDPFVLKEPNQCHSTETSEVEEIISQDFVSAVTYMQRLSPSATLLLGPGDSKRGV